MYGRRFGQAVRGLFAQQPWLCNGTVSAGFDVPVSSPDCGPCKPPIDNNPTPSYLSLSFGCLPLAGVIHVEFARKVPHSGVPEANPAETA
jgi:hypothetical protein